MPSYIGTGVDERGRHRTRRVRAATAAEAVETLVEQGLAGVRLLHDDTFVTHPDPADEEARSS